MFRSRFFLLSLFFCSLFALSLSRKPAHAQAEPATPTPFQISDTQLNPYAAPGPVGPYQSKDEIDYTTSLSGSLMFVKYWQPGYVPSGSTDNGGSGFEQQEFTPIMDGAPHSYFDTRIWSDILSMWQVTGVHATGSACYYTVHMVGFVSNPPGPSMQVDAWGAMLYYTWMQPSS